VTRAGHSEAEPDELATAIAGARRMLRDGQTLEAVWRRLRATGWDMIGSKRITMRAAGMSAREAQRALNESVAWEDMRPAVDRLEDAVIEAALEVGATVRIDGQPVDAKRTG
jgi:hypothetical protein